jgi:predicted nucleotide-binding protein (sugar kinase/HSP70/actin superfamily)
VKLAVPYMGTAPIALEAIFCALGAEVLVPSKTTRETLEIGARLSPESMCVPFKLTLGNMVRSLDAGADVIIYPAGSWSCRFGYYGQLQAEILRDEGYRFRLLQLRQKRIGEVAREIIALNHGRLSSAVLSSARALRNGWLKSTTVEEVESRFREALPNARDARACCRLFDTLIQEVRTTSSPAALTRIRSTARAQFGALPKNGRTRILRVKLVGESYCVIEPFINFDVIARMGEMGVLVDPFLTSHRWIGFHGFRLNKAEIIQMRRLSAPYWRYCVGGEDQNSVGHLLLAAQQGYDGVIHVHPFGCMPATVVQPTMTKAARDNNIAYLPLSLDEHSSETGVVTRLEAFTSLLEKRQRRHPV